MGDSATLSLIKDKLKEYNINASKVIFEVTESIAINNITLAAEFLSQLQKLGCQTALDDFGAGYSSFSYLKDLPVNFVKFDGSYVQNLTSDSVKRAIVVAMNDVAHALGRKTIAEFVEDQKTLNELQTIGIDYCQGYYTGKPRNLDSTAPGNVVYLRK